MMLIWSVSSEKVANMVSDEPHQLKMLHELYMFMCLLLEKGYIFSTIFAFLLWHDFDERHKGIIPYDS